MSLNRLTPSLVWRPPSPVSNHTTHTFHPLSSFLFQDNVLRLWMGVAAFSLRRCNETLQRFAYPWYIMSLGFLTRWSIGPVFFLRGIFVCVGGERTRELQGASIIRHVSNCLFFFLKPSADSDTADYPKSGTKLKSREQLFDSAQRSINVHRVLRPLWS